MLKRRVLYFLLPALLFLQACGTTRPVEQAPSPAFEDISSVVISRELADDPEMEALVAPYRERLVQMIAREIGVAANEITKATPEGRLGNLAADAMLEITHEYTDRPIDFAITNNGGLRVPIAAGPITVGHIYELMPFENTNVILTLTGEQVVEVAGEMAAIGGEPVAGLSYVITAEGAVEDVAVAGQPVVPDRLYRVVTSNYLAFGGGDMPTLWDAVEVEQTPLLLRDSIIEYIERQHEAGRQIDPPLEGRVRIAE